MYTKLRKYRRSFVPRDDLPDIRHQLIGNGFGRRAGGTLSVDPQDGLSIGSPQMYPVVTKFNPQSVLIIYGMLIVFLPDPFEQAFHIDFRSKGELVLGEWQSVIMAELDGPRERSVRLQAMGVASE